MEYEFKEGKVLLKNNVEEAQNIVYDTEKLVQETWGKGCCCLCLLFHSGNLEGIVIVPLEKFVEASYSKEVWGNQIVNDAEKIFEKMVEIRITLGEFFFWQK